MSSNPTSHPHVYKKGKVLNLKRLDEGSPSRDRKYVFASGTINLTQIVNSCNNINQIVGRNWLNLSKLLSYFGLSKDLSEKFSKKGTPSNFNKFFSDFKRGGDANNLKDLKTLLEKQKIDLENLSKKLSEIEGKLKPKSEGETEVLQKLEKIHEGLKQVLGV